MSNMKLNESNIMKNATKINVDHYHLENMYRYGFNQMELPATQQKTNRQITTKLQLSNKYE